MPDLDFTGLNEAAQAAFKPHFAEVQRRAGRRRRTRTVGVLAAVAVVATGSGVAVGAVRSQERPPAIAPGFGADRTPDFIPAPGATVTPGPGRQVSTGRPTAGDLDHLYLRYHDCRDQVCQLRYAASEDRGRTWRTGKLPVPDNAMVLLRAVGPRTLVAWYLDRAAPDSRSARWIASTDGGATWRQVTPRSVAALPTGWQVLAPDPGGLDREPLLAGDPATGDIAQLATLSKLENAAYAEGVPPTAGLWVSGSTGHRVGADGRVTFTGSAVEVSRDGGRSWQRHVFPEAVTASDDGFGAASVASHDGRTVYAVGRIGGKLSIWRSGDSGRSWQRAAGTAEVGIRTVKAAVRPDGTLVIQAGLSAGEDPLMFASTDGGRTVRPTTLGPGAAALPVPGGYVQTGWPDAKGAWLSTDGLTWSWVDPPDLP